jgi:hypothetical protein
MIHAKLVHHLRQEIQYHIQVEHLDIGLGLQISKVLRKVANDPLNKDFLKLIIVICLEMWVK